MTSTVLSAGTPLATRDANLTEGADRLAGRRGTILQHPRFLLALASTLMTIGITAILLGWIGAAHSTLLEEQVPYLISGGLLGLALSIIGALLVFTHWHTVAIREARAHEAARRRDHAELIEALHALVPKEVPDGRARSPRAERPLRKPSSGS
jgi:uncharacterized membrane protein YeaQ/YmgE (transglycosylase-associated protein family)